MLVDIDAVHTANQQQDNPNYSTVLGRAPDHRQLVDTSTPQVEGYWVDDYSLGLHFPSPIESANSQSAGPTATMMRANDGTGLVVISVGIDKPMW